jgi:Transposase IS116/IS110/IS902 family
VGRWLRYWLSTRTAIRPTTRLHYTRDVEQVLIPHLGRLCLADLDARRLRAAFAQIAQITNNKGLPQSASAMQHLRTTLRAALNLAVRDGVLESNPARHIEVTGYRKPHAQVWTDGRVEQWRQTGQRPAVSVWTAEHLATFLAGVAEDSLFVLWWLIGLRGLRRGEAYGLRWPEVDLDHGLLFIVRNRTTGRFSDHHAFLCQVILGRIDAASAASATLDTTIEAKITPFQAAIGRLDTIPGVGIRLAQVIIAETGGDMSRFATAAHLASWAGMCSGNNESAGKQHSGRTRPGDRWLRAAPGEAAIAVTRTKNNYLIARYRRLATRRGRKRALVAVGHSILIAVWHILTHNINYRDRGADYFLTRLDPARTARRLLDQLHQLGYQAHLKPIKAR